MTFGDYVYEKAISKNEEAVEDVKADECFHAKLEKKNKHPMMRRASNILIKPNNPSRR